MTIEERDPLYDEALQITIEEGEISTGVIQRRLRLGYVRAARIFDQLYENGIIEGFNGNRIRKISIDKN